LTLPVIQNRISPPVPVQGIIKRERLISLLTSNIGKNLTLIFSPAGYGKTALIQNFVTSHNWEYAWLNASADIDHIYTFFNYLVHALKQIDSKFGENTLEMVESRRQRYQLSRNTKVVVDDFVSIFINEFNKTFKDDVILVIDDFQNIEESKWIKETFNKLFASIPKKLHLVIISRQIPDFDFIPLIAKRNMLKIGMEDLIFRFDEIIDLLENIYSIEYSENGVKLLENNLGGWITGIHLTLQSYGKDFNNIKLDYQKIPENIFNFLADKIFSRLDSEIQNFLLVTSILDNFNEEICNEALGIKHSGEIINSLMSKNLFIQTMAVDKGNGNSLVYSYQILFKKFLVSRLYESNDKVNIKDMLKKVFNYYMKRGDKISAINYLILARDYETVIPVIKENFSSLFVDAQFEYLWKWLSSINEELILQNPYLLYFSGMLYKYYIGDLDASLDFFQRALNMFTDKDDQQFVIRCHLNKASVLLNLARTQEAISELTEKLGTETEADNRARYLYYLALAYYQNSEYNKSEGLLKQALEMCKNETLKRLRMDVLNLLGHIELIRGEYRKSAEYYECVLEGNPNVLHRFETLCNLILLDSQSGKYSKAEEFLTKLNELIEGFNTPILRIPYLLAKQAYYYESGNYTANIKVLQEINSTALAMNHKKYIYLSYRLLVDSYYFMNDLRKAREYYELSCKSLDKNNELEVMELKATLAMLNKRDNMDPSIENTMLEAYVYYNSNQFTHNKIQICYNLADYYMKKKDSTNTKKYLEECLRISSEMDYLSYLYRESHNCKELLEFALKNGMHADFVNTILNLHPSQKEIDSETEKAGF
jgi:ATP/maltotriose-dependent transcriptional regulator MalT